MSSTQPADTTTIEFQYDDEYRRKVLDERYIGGLINVEVTIGTEQIYGPPSHVATGFATTIALQLVESVEAALEQSRQLIWFDSGPHWLVIEPRDAASVNVVPCVTIEGARNPDQRLDIERPYPTDRQIWIEAALSAVENFCCVIVELDHSLDHHETIEELQSNIKNAKRLARLE